MCGINGLINYSQENLSEYVRQMNYEIGHRGPNADGIYRDNEFCLGHVRLSVLDLNEHANQPFKDEAYVLVYNGEIYNYKELRTKYKLNCKTSSDTEVLFEGLKKFGAKFISELNGMFAFAFYNKEENELLIARDRIGIKPIYYIEKEGKLAFSSELKGLKKVQKLLSGFSVNQNAINSFLYLGYIPKPLTIYNEVNKFPPGHYAFFKNGVFSLKSYWNLDDQIKEETYNDEAEVKKELKRLVESSVELRLQSDVPFGTFLSGGIDSSLVSAIAQNILDEKINTFSIGSENLEYNEAHFAESVANHINSAHHEFMVSDTDVKELVNDVVHHFDEPFADTSCLPTMMVSKLAKKHVTMTLSGDGGDELFHGYGFYNWANRLSNPFIKASRKVIGKALEFGDNRMKRASSLFSYPKGKLKSHIFSQEEYMFSQKEISNLLEVDSKSPEFIDNESSFARDLSPKEAQSIFDLNYYLRDDLLNKVDISSMRYSLETRVPLLDHRIIEFGVNVNENLKIKKGQQKYILKEVLYDYVPRELFDRPKKGFSIPLKDWLSRDLGYLIDNNLSKEAIESIGLLNSKMALQIVRRFRSGESFLFMRVWVMVLLQSWYKQNVLSR